MVMTNYKVTSPDGIPYNIMAPDDAPQTQVIQKAQEFHSQLAKMDVPWDRIQKIESNGNPNAVSPKGAVGDMQTMPKTLKDPGFGVKPAKDNSPAEQHRVGVDYWSALKQKFKHPLLAAMAYNWGPGNLDDWLAGKNTPGVAHPDYTGHAKDWSMVPAETRKYLNKLIAGLGQGTHGP